jgi:hypothetical protein
VCIELHQSWERQQLLQTATADLHACADWTYMLQAGAHAAQ